MAESKEILFSGTSQSLLKAPVYEKPKHRALWYVILEEAFFKVCSTDEGKQLYGDPNKGATLEQAWRTQGLIMGKQTVCLLAKGRPPVPTSAIKDVDEMTPHELVTTLAKILTLSDVAPPVTMAYDGAISHCVSLFSYDAKTSRFTYHDGWPGRSLLCKEYSAAGVDAQKTDHATLWTITAEELERVIFASFVLPYLWAEYNHEKYFTSYDELENSDFWSFFHITEADRRPEANGNVDITLRPGGFQSEIDLRVTLDREQRVYDGKLNVKRTWVTGYGPSYSINPFALDIVRSFIPAITPPPDRPKLQDLVDMLRKIKDRDYVRKLLESKERSLQSALLTYLGQGDASLDLPLTFSHIRMNNSVDQKIGWLHIEIMNELA